jgi:hypothetical protein
MAISWELYLSRRKIKLGLWIKTNNIRTYDDVLRACATKGVTPPNKDVYDSSIEPLLPAKVSSSAQKSVTAKKPKAVVSRPVKTKSPSSSNTRKKPAPKKKSGDK